jgi:hypothetical protein
MPVRCSSALLAPFLLIVRGLSGNVGPDTNINTVTLPPRRNWKNAWQKPTLMVRTCDVLAYPFSDFVPDPPIKRFAQRHTYHSTDAIAARDLGVAIVRQNSGTASYGGSSNSLGRTETQTSLMASGSTPQSTPAPTAPPAQHKRPPSPDHKRRDSDSHGPGQYKRARASSPPGRDRDRWDGHGSGRKRYNSPSWDRDRDRDAPPPPQAPQRRAREQEEEKTVNIPSVISWFVGTLPGPSAFDGKWPYMRSSIFVCGQDSDDYE